MNSRGFKPRPSRFDDPARWWFLTPHGFEKFKRIRVSQGYEILSRHAAFPHLMAEGISERAGQHFPKQTWEELSLERFRFSVPLRICGPNEIWRRCAGVLSSLKSRLRAR